jgi:2-keto-3-deoxy-L-rhamnonate aldolase RhmA
MSDSREKLAALFGRLPASGCWLDLPSPEAAEIVARAGADFGVVDLEHGPASVETAGRMLTALRAGGAAAIARPPERSEPWIKRLLDSGADGVVVPMVDTPEQAAEAAAWLRYPPLGRRGVAASVARAAGWGADAAAYLAGWNARAFLAVQIESPEALAAAPEIAEVDGVDLLFFGPADFSARSGFADGPADPRARAAFEAVAAAAQGAGKAVGSVAFPAMDGPALAAAGCDMIAAASDVAALLGGVAAAVAGGRGLGA